MGVESILVDPQVLLSGSRSRPLLIRRLDALLEVRADHIYLADTLREPQHIPELRIDILQSLQEFCWVFEFLFVMGRDEVVPCCSTDLGPGLGHELFPVSWMKMTSSR